MPQLMSLGASLHCSQNIARRINFRWSWACPSLRVSPRSESAPRSPFSGGAERTRARCALKPRRRGLGNWLQFFGGFHPLTRLFSLPEAVTGCDCPEGISPIQRAAYSICGFHTGHALANTAPPHSIYSIWPKGTNKNLTRPGMWRYMRAASCPREIRL